MAGEPRSVDPEDLKAAFKRAADIAAVVPEPMQEAAFHRALDQLLSTGGEAPAPPAAPVPRRGSRRRKDIQEDTSGDDNATRLIQEINRTKYPEIASASKVLDRALAVLRLASRDFSIDGLTAPEIAKVLTEKFRQRTSRQAVGQALGGAHTMVDTGKRKGVTLYRIMQPGEDYLDAGGAESQEGERQPAVPRRRRRGRARGRHASSKSKTSTAEETTVTKEPRRSGRRGPKTVVGELIEEGFFGDPRTMSETQEQLRHKKGVQFTLQDLSPAFVRLLREGRLDRDRNDSGQYEYRSK